MHIQSIQNSLARRGRSCELEALDRARLVGEADDSVGGDHIVKVKRPPAVERNRVAGERQALEVPVHPKPHSRQSPTS